MADSAIITDKDGFPVLVDSEVLLSETAVAEPEAPEAGGGPEGQPEPEAQPLRSSVKPEDVSYDEWTRRQSHVRSLAREFDQLDEGDIREFLKGRTTRDLTDEEIAQIHHDVKSQRLSDLADVFDNQLRSTVEQMKRARRTVRVSAPRGWTNRAFKQLDQQGMEQLCAHLISRGHDSNTLIKKVVSRVADEGVRQAITDRLESGDLKVEG